MIKGASRERGATAVRFATALPSSLLTASGIAVFVFCLAAVYGLRQRVAEAARSLVAGFDKSDCSGPAASCATSNVSS